MHIAYAVIFLGAGLCFFFSRKQKRQVRLAATRFALAFLDISNTLSPSPPADLPLVGDLDGEPRLFPREKQPKSIRRIMARIAESRIEQAFHTLSEALEELETACGRNRRLHEQFAAPLRELFFTVHTFLVGCEHPEALCGREQLDRFARFLSEQTTYRRELRCRIAGEAADEFDSRNVHYPLFNI